MGGWVANVLRGTARFRPEFLEQRRRGLAYFLTCVLLNPEFAASPLVKDFLLHEKV